MVGKIPQILGAEHVQPEPCSMSAIDPLPTDEPNLRVVFTFNAATSTVAATSAVALMSFCRLSRRFATSLVHPGTGAILSATPTASTFRSRPSPTLTEVAAAA